MRGRPRLRRSGGIISALCLLTLAGAARLAWADIYSFTDTDGVTHFSNVPSDPSVGGELHQR